MCLLDIQWQLFCSKIYIYLWQLFYPRLRFPCCHLGYYFSWILEQKKFWADLRLGSFSYRWRSGAYQDWIFQNSRFRAKIGSFDWLALWRQFSKWSKSSKRQKYEEFALERKQRRINPITLRKEPYITLSQRLPRQFFSFTFLIFSVLLVLGAVISGKFLNPCTWWRSRSTSNQNAGFKNEKK